MCPTRLSLLRIYLVSCFGVALHESSPHLLAAWQQQIHAPDCGWQQLGQCRVPQNRVRFGSIRTAKNLIFLLFEWSPASVPNLRPFPVSPYSRVSNNSVAITKRCPWKGLWNERTKRNPSGWGVWIPRRVSLHCGKFSRVSSNRRGRRRYTIQDYIGLYTDWRHPGSFRIRIVIIDNCGLNNKI